MRRNTKSLVLPLFFRLAAAALLCQWLSACTEKQVPRPSPTDDPPFKVVVIGEGLAPTESSQDRQYPLFLSGAAAMGRGARAAFQSETVAYLRSVASLAFEDDYGKVEVAEELAHELEADPSVLAIVGHASSGATKAALDHYAAAGIPVLMPIATSPAVSSSNAFRLPLDDHLGQAPALAAIVLETKHPKVFFVQDVSEDAEQYSLPLLRKTKAMIPSSAFEWEVQVDIDRPSFRDVARMDALRRATHLVFIGYSSTALELLAALSETATARPDDLKVILSDGSLTEDISLPGYDVFLTAPIPDLSDEEVCDGPEADHARQTIRPGRTPNYEIYGFDAILLIAQAAELCKTRLDRPCLINALKRHRLSGVCNDYVFKAGENIEGKYFAYKQSPEPDYKWLLKNTFDARTLNSTLTHDGPTQ